MIENTEKIQISEQTCLSGLCDMSKAVFFDIETTGFSPENTILYLIGCAYIENNEYVLHQWMCDTVDSEEPILRCFIDFLKNFQYIIHYNGSGFDIPYIIKKCNSYNIDCDFSHLKSIDIYKLIAPLKKLIKSENLKQKSIEEFLGITREDTYDGDRLIKVYYEYLANHSNQLRSLLLLHNHDDIIGMTRIVNILTYTAILDGRYSFASIEEADRTYSSGEKGKEIIITLTLDDASVPRRVSCGNDSFYLSMYDNVIKICITAYTNELKYFYPNYRDYYYLPAEDRSIHKSVAFYVDKDFRTKAKAANCYSKKTGVFLPQYEEIITPYFKIDYYDKTLYFEFTEEFCNSVEDIIKYCKHIIKRLL